MWIVRTPMIAVIDDDAHVREATASLLRSIGYGTTLYASADAFLDEAELDGIDGIVTDQQMPGRSGIELGQWLRDRGFAKAVILMTAYPSDALRARAEALKLAEVLEKPVDPERLSRALVKALG
ncbi:response regulator transcription factor [Sphingomonas sp. RS6]